jgi:hypothetical protein
MVDYAKMYQDTLGRKASDKELAYWNGQGAGALSSFVASANKEIASRPAAPAPGASGYTPPVTKTSTAANTPSLRTASDVDINQYYKNSLGRKATPAEIKWWQSTGYGGKELAQQLVNAGAAERSSTGYTPFEHDGLTDGEAADRFISIGGKLFNNPAYDQAAFDARGLLNTEKKTKTTTTATGGGVTAADVNTPRRDDSVARGVNALTAQDSAMMRQARTAGLQRANARGLLNSSMAVGAAQNEAYRAAIPIASQDASQAYGENMANLDIAARFGLQANDLASRTQLAQMDITSRENMQFRDIDYNMGRDQLNKYLAEMGNNTEQQRIMATFFTTQEQIYAARISDIMGNTNLDAQTRTEQLQAAKNSFTGQMDAISNILGVDVTEFMLWDMAA